MNKKSIRIILIPLVLILLLITVIYGSRLEMTTCVYKNKTENENATSFGFKMYANNEISSNFKGKSIDLTGGAKNLKIPM